MGWEQFRQYLRDRRPLFGAYITIPNADALELIAADWDWLWIDQQHSPISNQEVALLVRIAEQAGAAPLVRVKHNDEVAIGLALDHGAAGVIVPMVNTAEDAERAVSAAKFPPLGQRSVGSRRLMSQRGRNYWASSNEEISVVVQLESARAIENTRSIASVPGVDALFLGVDDWLAETGVELHFPADMQQLRLGIEKIAAEALDLKCAFGCFCDDVSSVAEARSLGASLLICAEDWLLLQIGSRQAASNSRKVWL